MKPKQIKELVKIFENSNIGELEVTKWWGNKVKIKKTSANDLYVTPQVADTHVSSSAVSHTSMPKELEQVEQKVEMEKPEVTNNLVEIKSPMVGTFYRAPAPDAAPYIEVGDTISPGKVLCIVEAMKLMNEIEAEIAGKIIEIMVENAQPVEYNQVLFRVQKS